MRYTLALVALLLTGCAGFTQLEPVDQVAVTCASYARTLNALKPFKPQMTVAQVASINEANAVVSPICDQITVSDEVPQSALVAIRDHLRRLVEIQNQVQ